nr:type I restriction enzyme HsdR N-terminal domain-containing protein [Methylomonas sp. SURF-2]
MKIGRQTLIVGQTQSRKKDTVGGRLDILVQREGRNLLIVETKADGLQLTDDDRDQAISYARLVHPIAPYAVVTNGKDYKLYHTVTKTQIEPTDINVNGFNIALPDDDILEAQSLFLSLSPTNLNAFCRLQVESELRIVKGTLADGRKYVPELHFPRESILTKVMEFYSSPLPGLMIIGQSGSGKTSEMCWLAENLLDKGRPVLFFNGVALEAGILEAIASEFAWTFNGADQPIQIIRRMARLAGSEMLTIIVDAIDEWIYISRESHLGALLRAAEHNNIKIILSCKTSAVEQFMLVRGSPTNIDLLSRKIEIGEFSDKDFYYAIDKYRQAYQFFGNFEDTVLDEARSNPFLLRVLFDVAKNSNLKHLTFSSAEFFETYFHRSIDRIADKRQAEITLKAIAGLLYERDADWIPEDDVRELLNLRITESIMDELFEYGILFRNETRTGIAAIGFYFQQLRDYIIAFKVCRFDTYSQQQLESEFRQIMTMGSRIDVFTLYYRLASTERKLIIDHELRKNATSYLHQYTSLIELHFPALRDTFKPKTQGRIGFIGEILLSQRRLGSYGFRPLGELDDEVHFVPVQKILGNSNLAYLDGANQLQMRGSARGFQNGIDILAEIVDGELIAQLEQFLKEGLLNESKCPEMLEEYIIETVIRNNAIFQDLLEADGCSIRYPLNLDEVLKAILREQLVRHFRDELISARRRSGQINESWNGGFISYSPQLLAEDHKQILNSAENSLSSDHLPARFHSRYVDLEILERPLARAINWLRPIKAVIDGPMFDGERKLKTDVKRGNPVSYEDAKSYLIWLYSTFLENYKNIIETNFPTLKHHFHFYSKLPISVYIEIREPEERHPGVSYTPLGIYLLESQSSISEVKIVKDLVRNNEDMSSYTADGDEFNAFHEKWISFENLFRGWRAQMNDPFQGMPLRRLVYETISHELKTVKKVFQEQY